MILNSSDIDINPAINEFSTVVPSFRVKMKPLPSEFIEKYIKNAPVGRIITPAGLKILVSLEQKKGKLKTDCLVCENHDILKGALQQIRDSSDPVTKAFLVKSPDPFDHITPVYVRKREGEFRVILMDTGGGRDYYDPSTLFDLDALSIPNLVVYSLWEQRQWDRGTCPIFSFADVMSMSNIENIFELVEEKTKDRVAIPLTRENAPLTPFKPLYLKDLPPQFIKFTTRYKVIEDYIQQLNEQMAVSLRDSVKPHLVDAIVNGKVVQSNIWAHKRKDKYIATIENTLMKEHYLKTTPLGKVITPAGLNVLIDVLKKDGKLSVDCTAYEDHDSLKKGLEEIRNSSENVTKAFLVKSQPPFDHITPVYVRKDDGRFQVVLMDTQGGETHYDTSTFFDLQSLNIPRLEIYHLVEKREWDKTNAAAFALHDILSISKYENFFEYIESVTVDRSTMKLGSPHEIYKPQLFYMPIYLKDLPVEFLEFTTDLQVLERNLSGRDPSIVEPLKEKVEASIGEIHYGEVLVKANLLAFRYFEEYASLLERTLE